MKGKELIKLLEDEGWVLDRISGSHHIMVKDGMRSIPIPIHKGKEIPKILVKIILKQDQVKRN